MRYFVVLSTLDEEDDCAIPRLEIECADETSAKLLENMIEIGLSFHAVETWILTTCREE